MSVYSECCVLSCMAPAMGLSHIQRSPTECGVSDCDRESSKREAMTQKGRSFTGKQSGIA